MNIKYLDEYTKEELHTLTEEDKEHIFAIECAARGVALPSALLEIPADPEDRPELGEDVTLYKLKNGGYGSRDTYFKTAEEAQTVADLVNSTSVKVENSYQAGKSRYYLGSEKSDYDTVGVEQVSVYSLGKWTELKGEINKFDKTKKERDNIISENRKTRAEHDKIWEEINKAINEANYEYKTAERLTNQFSEYKKLANNDKAIAKKFLVKAHYNDLINLSPEALETVGLTKDDLVLEDEKPKTTDDVSDDPLDVSDIKF